MSVIRRSPGERAVGALNFNSVINFAFLFAANRLSRRTNQTSLW